MVNPDDYLRGFGAKVNRFDFVFDEEALPVVYTCPTHGCETLAWFCGVTVEREGHVTCMRCLRPMERAECTVH